MGKGKKTFIDRKNAVTFHLVHRSQHDPLVTDDTAPQRVLVEAAGTNSEQSESTQIDTEKRREEQQKYGILFDDDYNYLQHLKKPEQNIVWEYVENPNQTRKRVDEGRVTNVPKLVLPSSVFASEFEEDEGMLNKAAPRFGPQLEWDPDVLAAMDDDFAFDDAENQLQDDFVSQAMGGDEIDTDDDDESEGDDKSYATDSNNSNDSENEDEMFDKLGPLRRAQRFNDEETKSRFTEYSMSSSVIRRNEQLSLLDDQFERFYDSYNDAELGDLMTDNIEGTLQQNDALVLECLQEYKKIDKPLPYNKKWDKKRLKKYRFVADDETEQTEELDEIEVEDAKSKKWDCESILSTYTNIYNHPKCIDDAVQQQRKQKKIEIDAKTGLPNNVLRNGADNKLNEKALAELSESKNEQQGPKSLCAKSVLSTLSVLSIRPKDETPEEKRERKHLLKEYRAERRMERKANTEAFKEEQKRQTKMQIHQRTCLQGKKIV